MDFRPLIRRAPLLLLFLALQSCQDPGMEGAAPGELHGGTVVLRAAPGILMDGTDPREDQEGPASADMTRPLVELPADHVVYGVQVHNLDLDDEMEQILVYKKSSDPLDVIYLGLVDDQGGTRSPSVTWEGGTLASNIATFDVRVIDVLGNHQQTIVAHGLTKDGSQTLSLFQPRTGQIGLGAEILFQLSADSEVALGTVSRNAAYEENLASADPFPVFVVEKDRRVGSDALIRSTYTWNPDIRRFVVTRTETIETMALSTVQMQTLFAGRVQDIERAMQGAWIRRTGALQQVVFFDADFRKVRIIDGSLLEGYDWTNSTKSPAQGRINLFLSNEAFSSVKTILSITFNDLDRLNVAFADKPEWTGAYTRLDIKTDEVIKKNALSRIPVYPLVPQGDFVGQDGSELIFNGFNVVRRRGNGREEGSFVTFNLGGNILSLAFLNEQGLLQGVEHYRFSLSDTRDDVTGQTLELEPVALEIDRVIPLGNVVGRYVRR